MMYTIGIIYKDVFLHEKSKFRRDFFIRLYFYLEKGYSIE